MTLTDVLLRHVLKASLIVVGGAVLSSWIFFGADVAVGLAVGAALSIGDAAGMIYLVGEIMNPDLGSGRKVAFTVLLVVKLTVVGGLFYLAFDRYGVSGLGLVVGIGVGLIATVWGVARGSASEAGQQAIARAEARITKDLEDSGNQTR